jgi:hypothetical protein
MNRLVVSGDDAEEFLSHSRLDSGAGDFSFSALVPEPAYENDEQWYDWRNENWGVKWDVSGDDVRIERYPNAVSIHFETPWNAPIYWLHTVSRMYPTLGFQIFAGEPGMNFHEEWVVKRGETISHTTARFEDFLDFWGFPELAENYETAM